MADNSAQAPQETPKPSPALKRLDKLVGTWKVSGPDIRGKVTFEWLEGGFFLIQDVDFVQSGQRIKGIEIIGHERGFGATEPSKDLKSRYFDNEGNTFDYVWELGNDTLTIWGGQKGSPAHFKGKLNKDGNSCTGRWVWPGGGYESTMTWVK